MLKMAKKRAKKSKKLSCHPEITCPPKPRQGEGWVSGFKP